jgi:hypothetical protein
MLPIDSEVVFHRSEHPRNTRASLCKDAANEIIIPTFCRIYQQRRGVFFEGWIAGSSGAKTRFVLLPGNDAPRA